jgi:hypothetical protein
VTLQPDNLSGPGVLPDCNRFSLPRRELLAPGLVGLLAAQGTATGHHFIVEGGCLRPELTLYFNSITRDPFAQRVAKTTTKETGIWGCSVTDDLAIAFCPLYWRVGMRFPPWKAKFTWRLSHAPVTAPRQDIDEGYRWRDSGCNFDSLRHSRMIAPEVRILRSVPFTWMARSECPGQPGQS